MKGQERFLAYLRGKSDEQLERIVGAGPCMKAIFRAMAKRFQPDRAQGFSGSIQYELRGATRTHRWAVQVAGRRAAARSGWAHDPAVTLKMSVPSFGRIVSGELEAAQAFFEGRIVVEGDLGVAARLGEMFGARSNF